jgi:D-lactate dehydrogenase
VAGGVVVSFERMRRIVDIRPGDRCAVVEPGVLNGDLQAALRPHGLFWPADPTSAGYSTVGGNLACNAGGPRAVKYGASRDNVLALTAVTGAGERIHCGSATTKGATGYDLQRLLVGSEGTLALIVEATLRLTPLPAQRRVLRAVYRDVASAAQAVARLMAQPVTPSMLEFMDAHCVGLSRDVGGVDLPRDAGALLMIDADGDAQTLPQGV